MSRTGILPVLFSLASTGETPVVLMGKMPMLRECDGPGFGGGMFTERRSYARVAGLLGHLSAHHPRRMLPGFESAARDFLRAQCQSAAGRPLRVLQIGAGDAAPFLQDWSRRRKMDIRLSCVDRDVGGDELASLASAGASVELVREDIFRHFPPQPYDCAIAQSVLARFSTPGILALMNHLRTVVRRSVMMYELWPGAGLKELRKATRALTCVVLDVRGSTWPGLRAVLHFSERSAA